jgi:ethanolamine utilization cobalamin adenosyltransferase
MFKLSDFLEKFKSIQPLSKDIQDIATIIKNITNIEIPVGKIVLGRSILGLDIEQIKKSVIFRKEQQIKDAIQQSLNIRIDKLL